MSQESKRHVAHACGVMDRCLAAPAGSDGTASGAPYRVPTAPGFDTYASNRCRSGLFPRLSFSRVQLNPDTPLRAPSSVQFLESKESDFFLQTCSSSHVSTAL